MKKLNLDLDALRVESFDTAAAAPERGTVHAAQAYCAYCCCCCCCCTCACSGYNTCAGQNTCEAGWTCNNTCAPYQTCPGYPSCASCNTCPGQYSCDNTCQASCYYTDCNCGGTGGGSEGYRFCPVEPY